jgi:hypothetical protein
MQITRKSIITGIQRTMDIPVNPEDFVSWQSGYGNIQDVMPYLSDVHREFILSGITAKEWDEAFLESTSEQ